MTANEDTGLHLYEQIIEELLEALRGSDLFDPAEVDELLELAESKRLHRTEAVIDLLEAPDG